MMTADEVSGVAVGDTVEQDRPRERRARWGLIAEGYVRGGGARVGSTVAWVTDGAVTVVVDPGMVADQALILQPLGEAGIDPEGVTDVVFSHHHPDHTLNAGLFPRARVHDHWAVYDGDRWISRDADRFELTPSVRLLQTPGHSREDIATCAGTAQGVVVFTHLWWSERGPADDPYAPDRAVLRRSRERVLAIADLIVPGHGPPFAPGPTTPR